HAPASSRIGSACECWLGNSVSTREQEAPRRATRRAMRIGLAVWPAFITLDAFMCFVVFPGAPFLRFLLCRVVVEACLWAVYRMSRRPDLRLGRLSLCRNLTFFAAALGVSVMALGLGGPTSAYVHGLSIILLVRATVLPEPWRRAVFTSAPIALAFPAVMAVGAF